MTRVVLGDSLLLGNDLLVWLVLALGAAMVVGNGLALVKPPRRAPDGQLARAPVTRTLVMVGIGTIAAIWSLASLLGG